MFPHHIKLDVCENRPKYRQGRKYTSVKVRSQDQDEDELNLALSLRLPLIY